MSRYTIERACLNDVQDEIVELLQRNLSGITDDHYQWAYLNYPYEPAITWLSRDLQNNNEIVGVCSLFLREVIIDGKSFLAGVTADLAVDKAHRAYGPALSLQKRLVSDAISEGVDFIYSITSANSELLNKRVGFKKVGTYNRYVKLLKSEYKNNKSVLPEKIPETLSGIADFLIKLASRETWYRRPKGIQVAEEYCFDARFNVLNEERNVSGIIAGARSSKFLEWRYLGGASKNYRIFTISEQQNQLLGYIVFYIQENIAYIADIQCADQEKYFKMILLDFFCYMRREGMGSVSIRCVGKPCEKLIGMNFIKDKRSNANLYCYIEERSDLASLLLNAGRWYFMEGDNDI